MWLCVCVCRCIRMCSEMYLTPDDESKTPVMKRLSCLSCLLTETPLSTREVMRGRNLSVQ